jgi:hypothetical protein
MYKNSGRENDGIDFFTRFCPPVLVPSDPKRGPCRHADLPLLPNLFGAPFVLDDFYHKVINRGPWDYKQDFNLDDSKFPKSLYGDGRGRSCRPNSNKTRIRLLSQWMPSVSVKQLLKAAPFLIAVLALAEFSGCDLCKDEVLEKASSPDGKWVATIKTRDCGATTSEYIAVNLQDAQQRRLDEENDVFVIKHLHPLHVFWRGNDSLIIDCENCNLDEAEKKLGKLGPVQIMYR